MSFDGSLSISRACCGLLICDGTRFKSHLNAVYLVSRGPLEPYPIKTTPVLHDKGAPLVF